MSILTRSMCVTLTLFVLTSLPILSFAETILGDVKRKITVVMPGNTLSVDGGILTGLVLVYGGELNVFNNGKINGLVIAGAGSLVNCYWGGEFLKKITIADNSNFSASNCVLHKRLEATGADTIELEVTTAGNILVKSSKYLRTWASHSKQIKLYDMQGDISISSTEIDGSLLITNTTIGGQIELTGNTLIGGKVKITDNQGVIVVGNNVFSDLNFLARNNQMDQIVLIQNIFDSMTKVRVLDNYNALLIDNDFGGDVTVKSEPCTFDANTVAGELVENCN
ncbi:MULTISPECIES: hypothetical protein [Vibrio]|uniref:hypothetical protein n=1 Tax=Vibrio TaxID=662 RepID=UPI001CDD3243|nr:MULTISPECIES: hypothetical protein [Vibrio]MCA2454839.1 hypothetical protein [Vibrio alginolyticus]MCA2460324.1 hypothetical protein [Vibrio alginolyticus]MDW2266708.1 hypothetical protein [Vibrio sp. 1394]MDW2293738.1 hypothetical protein [Vibrio sp. 1404]